MKIRLQNTSDDELLLQENIFCQRKFVKAGFTELTVKLIWELRLQCLRQGGRASSQVVRCVQMSFSAWDRDRDRASSQVVKCGQIGRGRNDVKIQSLSVVGGNLILIGPKSDWPPRSDRVRKSNYDFMDREVDGRTDVVWFWISKVNMLRKNTKQYLDSGLVSEQVKDRAGVRQDCWTKACGIKFQRALTASGRETKDWQTVRPALSRLYNDTNTQNL